MAAKQSMTKAEVVSQLAEKLGVTKKLTQTFLEDLVQLAYSEVLKKDTEFTIPGLGKLTAVERKERKGRNPATGAEITIPAKTVLKFRIAKACKDAIVPSKA